MVRQARPGASDSIVVWCDASNLAMGVVLEIDGNVIEDGTWMRPVDDKRHINVVELEAALKGIKLALMWHVDYLVLRTDSRPVACWLEQVVGNVCRVKTSGLNDVLIQGRMQIIADMIDLAHCPVGSEWVPSAANHADCLTRVPEAWVAYGKTLLKRGLPMARPC